jgi:single-strand DNA-binding protein
MRKDDKMAGETNITITGNITADPELRITPDAVARATFTVASSPRVRDSSGQWADGPTLFLRCTAWRTLAENVAESLTKGARVTVRGRLTQRTFETREGQRRTVLQIEVDEVAASLRFARLTIVKNTYPPLTATA